MGNDNYFNKHREERRKRRENILKQKSDNWLIVCEGCETEKNYFKEAVNDINNYFPKEFKLKVKIVGQGMNTKSLVNSVENILNEVDKYNSDIYYGKIFIVFDKDSFSSNNFNSAIELCIKNNYIPLWSNQAIEFWFLLHFNYITSNINRSEYKEKLEEYFKSAGLNSKYYKNDKKIYNKLCLYGSLEKAIERAKKIHENYKNTSPAKAVSSTTVYKFFEEVKERKEEIK